MFTPFVAITRRARYHDLFDVPTHDEVTRADIVCFCACEPEPHPPTTCCHAHVWPECVVNGMCGFSDCRGACTTHEHPVRNTERERSLRLRGVA